MSAAAAPPNYAADGAAWRVINDDVMGGVSSSSVSSDGGAVAFRGEVRTEYNGGFASARRELDAALARGAVGAIGVRARGDGHRYRLNLYTRDARGAPQWFNYHAQFDTEAGSETWQRLPLASFAAGFRGRPVMDAPPLAWADVTGIGLMLLKTGHRAGRGPFALEVLQLTPQP